MYSLRFKLYTNPTFTVHKTLHCNPALQPYKKHRKEPTQEPSTEPCIFLNTNHAKGASVLFVVTVCQNAHFGFTLEGASEWLRCKALRMRAQRVY